VGVTTHGLVIPHTANGTAGIGPAKASNALLTCTGVWERLLMGGTAWFGPQGRHAAHMSPG